MCMKNTTYNGCHSGLWSLTNYMGSGTCWISNKQDEYVEHIFIQVPRLNITRIYPRNISRIEYTIDYF